jgi:hypothetical protein
MKGEYYVSYSFSFVNKLQISGKKKFEKKSSLFHLDFREGHFSYEIFVLSALV